MKKHRNGNKQQQTPAVGIAVGVVVALICSLLLTYLQTSLILRGTMSIENADNYIFLIRTVSVFIGTLLGSVLAEGKPVSITGMITGAYVVILLAISLLLFDASIRNLFSGVFSVLLGGMLNIIMKLKPQKRRKNFSQTRR